MVVPLEQQKKVSEDPVAFREQIDAASAAQGALADTALQPTALDEIPDVAATLDRLIGEDADGAAVGIPLADLVERQGSKRPYGASLIDDSMYSHFPVMAEGRNVLGVLYRRGRNHGQSDPVAVCLAQTPAAGGVQNLVINGNEASGGAVVLGPGAATQVMILSTADETARTFTVTGSLDGTPVVRSGVGGNNTSVTLTGLIDTITQVTVDGNTAGAVSVGLFRLASDIAYKFTEDGGATWSSRILLGDGMSSGQTVFNYPALGTCRGGSTIAVFAALDVPTGTWKRYQSKSFNGRDDWTPIQEMVISGPQGGAAAFYGQIKTTGKGVLVASQYSGNDNFVLVSYDDGETWISRLVVNSSSPNYTEQAIAIIDENVWVTVLRRDGNSGMMQAVTTDQGQTWSAPADTNLPISGGYQSHELNVVDVDGVSYVFLSYMARITATPPPTPEAICARWAKASDVVAAATNWGEEIVLQNALPDRSGYPSFYIHKDSGTALMAYGKETAERFAECRNIKVDVVHLIRKPLVDLAAQSAPLVALAPQSANLVPLGPLSAPLISLGTDAFINGVWTPVLSFQTPGDVAVTYAVGGQVGRFVKVGKLWHCTFEIIATNLTHSTALGIYVVTGLPAVSMTEGQQLCGVVDYQGITKANVSQIIARVGPTANRINFRGAASGQTSVDISVGDVPSGTAKRMVGAVTFIGRD